MKIRYSIIVPNRNHPELLIRALASIPVREDTEVIVVDDASDPSFMDMKHYPGMERPDSQVVLTTEGKGAGYARNVGLDRAKGEWLVFLDSDDFFMDGFMKLLEAHAEDTDDIVFFGITSVFSDTLEPATRHKSRMDALSRYSNRPHLLDFYCRNICREPWGKMIRRSLVVNNSIRFDETFCANDVMFSAKTGQAARSVSYDPRIFYCLTDRKGNLTDLRLENARKTADRLDVNWRLLQFFRSHGIYGILFFYPLFKECIQLGGETKRIAEQFKKDNHISRGNILFYTRLQELMHKLRIGVPYCK